MSDLFSGLANLTKQVTSNISTYEVRKITDKIQGYVMNYTEAENLVREATNEDPWGPTGPQMKEICNLTFQYDGFHQVCEMLWKRMFEDNKYAWRRVYKSLTLLNYLLQHGSERVIANSRDHVFQLRSLEHYKHIDEKGKDQGVNIRHRVGIILELLSDDDKLRTERKKAKADSKERYQGYTSDDIKMGRGGGYNDNNVSNNISRSSNTSSSNNKRYDDYDEDWDKDKKDNYSSKEVNAFQFPEDARQTSNSPELGFRQEDEHEDDGFGSFAASRSKDASSPSPAKFADFSGGSKPVHVPALPPPSIIRTTGPALAAAPTASASFDLLGLGDSVSQVSPISSSDPFGSTSQSQQADFFSGPAVTNATTAPPPRPPSGGGLIGSSPSPAQSNFKYETKDKEDLEIFSVDWNSASAVCTNTATDDIFGSFGAANQPAAVSSAAGGFNGFDAFGGMSSAAAPAVSPAPASNNIDLFANMTTPTPTSQLSSDLGDLFASNLTFSPMTSASAPVPSNKPTEAATPNKSQTNVGKTWAGTGGLGLIDLDNLAGKKSPGKANMSMNDLQKQKQGNSNTNLW